MNKYKCTKSFKAGDAFGDDVSVKEGILWESNAKFDTPPSNIYSSKGFTKMYCEDECIKVDYDSFHKYFKKED